MSIPHSDRNPSIKQNLFRFMQIKEPSLIYEQEETHAKAYVSPPDAKNSVFLGALEGKESQQAIDAILQSTVDAFSAYSSYHEVKEENEKLYKFSLWLKGNKRGITFDNLTLQTTDIATLSDPQLKSLWDNLFYQTLTNESPSIKEAVLKVLQAYHTFISFKTFTGERNGADEFTGDVRKQFERAATAAIMIPSKLVVRIPEEANGSTPNVKGDNTLMAYNESAILNAQINRLDSIAQEVDSLSKDYRKTNSAAYRLAYKLHEAAVEAAYNSAEVIDSETGERTYPNLELPEFEFEAANPLDNEYLEANLSIDAYNCIQGVKNEKHTKLEELVNLVELQSKELLEDQFSIELPQQRNFSIQGTLLSINPFPTNYKCVIETKSLYPSSNLDTIFLSIYNPDSEDRIKNVTLSIGEEEATVTRSENHSEGVTTYQLFKNGIDLSSGPVFLEGTIKSAKKGDLAVEINDFKKGETFLPGLIFGDELDGEPGIGRSTLYGVKRIGVAEFKRVEQELCCYVEGEVSHIENVLAREYKERATRNLTRTEITTEESQEKEAEQLTDTTTTDRHEMQSEVSKVIEEAKERSFGASIGSFVNYTGERISAGVNLGAYFDGSNSSSESNNFSTAENIAREVTERTLERVVNKTSKKRTSKMLREFEESTKHGFDNRKGDKHVTGIYRWVDKIYKNYLVNYGKRLTYEFAIPEPAKIWKNLVTQTKGSQHLTAEPLPPKPLTLTSPSGVTLSNYAQLASHYGAEVASPPDAQIILSKEFAETPVDLDLKNGDFYMGAYKSELELPEGYQVEEVDIKGEQMRHGSNINFTRTSIAIGTGKYRFNLANSFNLNLPNLDVGFIEQKLPIAFYTIDVAALAFTVTAKCLVKQEHLDNWKAITFLSLKDAYNEKYQEYLDKKAQWDAEQAAYNPNAKTEIVDYNQNPLLNRVTEQRELKRSAIQLMMNQWLHRMSRDHYTKPQYPTDCTQAWVIGQSSSLDSHAENVKFLEDAFDWNLMSYTFHPYFYSCAQDWRDLMNTKSSSDILFEAFLQSGMADVKVPVKGGYEKAVMYYLDTGIVLRKEEHVLLDRVDDYYKAVSQELRMDLHTTCCKCDEPEEDASCCQSNDESCIEAQWTSRIPTALTVVQNYARPLEANGLPCFSPTDERIQFCEDGTPISSDQPESGDPTVGLMEGFVDPNETETPA